MRTDAAGHGADRRAGHARRGRLTGVVLDKTGTVTTGTVTTGKRAVTDLAPLGAWSMNDLLRLAAGVERASEHSLGQAAARAA